MRFLFVSAQIPGHLDWGGYLATAAHLHRDGHEVLWVTGEGAMSLLAGQQVPGHAVTETGFRWPPPPPLAQTPEMTPEQVQYLRMVRSLDQWLDVPRVYQASQELLAVGQAFQPDLVVSEMFTAAAGLVAEQLQIPFVLVGWPAAVQKVAEQGQAVTETARERLQILLQQTGITGVNWTAEGPPAMQSPLLHVTYWSPTWYQGLPLLTQNRHVGGVAPTGPTPHPPWLHQLPMDRPWIFITLGTSFTSDPNFFVIAAHAAVKVGGLPIMAVGRGFAQKALDDLQKRLPSPRVVSTEVDFSQVLPYVSGAIHHGGAGTTHALVTHAIPQIVVPHAADQGRQADGIARTGVGVHLPARQMTVEQTVQILTTMLPNESPHRRNARMVQDEFSVLGGVPEAARLLVAAADGSLHS